MEQLVQPDWKPAVFLRRYKRFFADIQLPGGDELTVHCPNTGSMLNCLVQGSPCFYSLSDNPKRKLKGTLELVTSDHGGLVCVNTQRANQLVGELLSRHWMDELFSYESFRREQKPAGSNSRIDFCLAGERSTWLEIKSVTLVRESGLAEFPDAVTTRGQKHLQELQQLAGEGNRACLLFAVLVEHADRFGVAADLDPGYAAIAREVEQTGVELTAVHIKPRADGFHYRGQLPLQL